MQGYKNLIVWQKSVELATLIYSLTEAFPKEEKYGLISQLRRASVSVSANIAEGRLRGSEKEFRHFLLTSFGSGGELETLIEIAKRLPGTQKLDYSGIDSLLDEIMRMLNTMISKAKV